jgi:hypothetical protein
MSVDHNLQLRRAILPMLKAESVIASMTNGRVYSEAPKALPPFPFVRYGNSDGTPTEWSCTEGSENVVTIHVFSRADGTDECARLRKAVVRALDQKTRQLEVDPDTGSSATAVDMMVTGLPAIFRDTDDASAWHGVVQVSVTVAEDF